MEPLPLNRAPYTDVPDPLPPMRPVDHLEPQPLICRECQSRVVEESEIKCAACRENRPLGHREAFDLWRQVASPYWTGEP